MIGHVGFVHPRSQQNEPSPNRGYLVKDYSHCPLVPLVLYIYNFIIYFIFNFIIDFIFNFIIDFCLQLYNEVYHQSYRRLGL